jgi:hypothetical protein
MKTILQIDRFGEEWPIRLAAGLPGGIGDTGFECGGITAPVAYLGLRFGLREEVDGLPVIFYKGFDHLRRFLDRNGTPHCREIRRDNYRLRKCIKAVCCAPEITRAVAAGDGRGAIAGERREAYARLYSHLADRGFHCARAVFERLSPGIPLGPAWAEAASGFLGGTLFTGMTCGALAAGVMAFGSGMGEFENSLPRVIRMIVLMKTGGNAFADPINKFNVIMNRGKSLAGWFVEKFGDTQCRALTGCDFSSAADVDRYIETGAVGRCRAIAETVAGEVLRRARI